MFNVVGKVFNAEGQQIGTEDESEHQTELQAIARITYLEENCQGNPEIGEDYCHWHVEAV